MEHLLEDLHRLFKTKHISMEAVFPTAGVELSIRDFLNAHETLTRCGQEKRPRTHSASSFKRSLGLSNIPTPLRSGLAGSGPKGREKGDSILYKPRDTFNGMSPMEALLGVRTGEEIDPAMLGASRRGSRRLSMNPCTYNPERQDQLQTVYDYLKANRGSPVMSRIMGHANGETSSKLRSTSRRPKTAPSVTSAAAFTVTAAATGTERCGTEENDTPDADAQAVLGTSNACARQEGGTYRNLTFVHHGSKSAWSMREGGAAERGPATDDATSEAGGGLNRRNQVTEAYGPLGIYEVKTKDLMYLRAVIQPSAQLWLVAKGVYTLLQSHQHDVRDEAVRNESLGAAAVRFSGGGKTYSQKGLFGGHRHGAYAATVRLFQKEEKVPDFTWGELIALLCMPTACCACPAALSDFPIAHTRTEFSRTHISCRRRTLEARAALAARVPGQARVDPSLCCRGVAAFAHTRTHSGYRVAGHSEPRAHRETLARSLALVPVSAACTRRSLHCGWTGRPRRRAEPAAASARRGGTRCGD